MQGHGECAGGIYTSMMMDLRHAIACGGALTRKSFHRTSPFKGSELTGKETSVNVGSGSPRVIDDDADRTVVLSALVLSG